MCFAKHVPNGSESRDKMEPVRRGVHKELDTEETPMFIASQGRCWMGCDVSFCLNISFSWQQMIYSEFMCSQLQTRTDLGSYLGTCFI